MDAGDVIHIGRVDFRNDNREFGIKHEDRFSHVYVIGKTGTGKSTRSTGSSGVGMAPFLIAARGARLIRQMRCAHSCGGKNDIE